MVLPGKTAARPMISPAALLLATFASLSITAAEQPAPLRLVLEDHQVRVLRGEQPLATYVFDDAEIPRPYWKDVYSSSGAALTRRHPPVPGRDPTDHATMHPGLWLAFGDLNGHDFWRNKARVKHQRFVEPPAVHQGAVTLATQNHYLSEDNHVVGTEIARFQLELRPQGWALLWHSELRGKEGPLRLGAQEEMGWGIRVSNDLRVQDGRGSILNSLGGRNETETWGATAAWWATEFIVGQRRMGVLLKPLDTSTVAAFWGHTRDYGLLVVNPSPRPGSADKAVIIPATTVLRLELGLLFYDLPSGQPSELAAWADTLDRRP